MARIPVPDDYTGDTISVAGVKDYHYGEADVNLEDTPNARDLSVREDDGGRYVGPSGDYADEIRAYLGVESGGETAEDDEDDAVCGAELSNGGTCDRLAAECPYHGDTL